MCMQQTCNIPGDFFQGRIVQFPDGSAAFFSTRTDDFNFGLGSTVEEIRKTQIQRAACRIEELPVVDHSAVVESLVRQTKLPCSDPDDSAACLNELRRRGVPC